MSEYEFFDGSHGDHTEPVDDFDAFSVQTPLFEIDLALDGDLDLDEQGDGGVLDLDLDLGLDGLDGLDLTDLPDLLFDAGSDLVGADPDEAGWWIDLTSDHNHEGAYDEVTFDLR